MGNATPGWYHDPWGQAELRWWTGSEWTGWTHPAEPHTAADDTWGSDRRAVERGISDVLAEADRIAVIDVETTGLYRVDRVVEIAVVTMDASGTVLDEFDTLVNPGRDPGPTWIHGVTASMLIDAPAFDEIAHHLAVRLHGAVVVAHNLRFDTRMIGHELSRAGIDVDWGNGLDTLHATGCKLAVACAEYDIAIDNAHRALVDARATGKLLFAVADAFDRPCSPASATPLRHAQPRRILTRDGFGSASLDVPYLAELARGVRADPDVAPYVTLLDRAVSDLQLSTEERTELAALAHELGLDERQRERAHREFLNGLIDAALEDSVITDTELDQLCRVAALLDLDAKLITRRTNPYRITESTIALGAGLKVCFTGAALDELGSPIDRDAIIHPEARAHGLQTRDSLTKSCGLLIADDTASESTKVDTARRFGVPVASFADYRHALRTGNPLRVTNIGNPGIAQVCGTCGDSWMAARRSSTPLCAPCRSNRPANKAQSRITRAPKPPAPPAIETLNCTDCMGSWERPRTRGRRPTRCPDCVLGRAGANA
ncbi:exonuclease domain-containing protein [Mycolicibacterium fluoranthenivorans]|uniref:DNA polymerase-3 subunit epsilon n=1 Tax=Mycolicibacterium fluoranthenivorans TaxID=258505 RepID=A0A1G4WX84_9MYCO|nr:exonuclease domain-containing protein [Mycolicibacterium fluoranthenivorans]SCX31508.1 DNA polymerase-3 subunit epsilon [Mycolicibacterium fluoranthenivorans]